jgi:hypothetical protein
MLFVLDTDGFEADHVTKSLGVPHCPSLELAPSPLEAMVGMSKLSGR